MTGGQDGWSVLLTGLAVVVAAAVVGLVVVRLLRRLSRRLGLQVLSGAPWRSPVVCVVVLAALHGYNAWLRAPWAPTVAALLNVLLIAAVAWLLLVVGMVLERAALARFPQADLEDMRSRHARTQIVLLRRIASALVITVAAGAVLWQFPVVRELGGGLLASAGLLGIIAGIAAQTTLGNVFAGMQIAFTDAVRVGDIVVVDGEWGQIAEVTLTYVVLHVWNGTSLILPSTYFTTTPFRNWTHAGTRIVGEVDLAADWNVPVDEVRTELGRAAARSRYWDGETASLWVDDASGDHVVLRAQVGADQGDHLALLCWDVREALVGFLQRHPHALPRGRLQTQSGGDVGGAGAGGAGSG